MSVFRVHAKELGANERIEGAEHGMKPDGRKMGTRYFTGFVTGVDEAGWRCVREDGGRGDVGVVRRGD
jgi:hypothetical protein